MEINLIPLILFFFQKSKRLDVGLIFSVILVNRQHIGLIFGVIGGSPACRVTPSGNQVDGLPLVHSTVNRLLGQEARVGQICSFFFLRKSKIN